MRCNCLKCVHNIDGFCECSSYIEIDKNGECDSMWILIDREDDKMGMDEYIKREAAYREICADETMSGYEKAYCSELIRNIPAADVVPVRHGR